MKTIIMFLLSAFTFQAFATCPQVTGKYHCPKELEWDLIFESRNFEIIEEDIYGYKFFLTRSDKSLVGFPFNNWMPYMDELNEIIRDDVETSSECTKKELRLKLKIFPPEDEQNEDPFIMTYKISPLKKGIKVKVYLGDEFAFSSICEKQP